MKFVLIQDKTIADEIIKLGYKPLSSGSGFYIFENISSLTKFCNERFQEGAYIFTDKMFF